MVVSDSVVLSDDAYHSSEVMNNVSNFPIPRNVATFGLPLKQLKA